MGGGTLYDVTKHRGHQSSAMAESYAHLSADHMRKVAELPIPPVSVPRLSRGRSAAAAKDTTDGG